jgi:ribosome-binding protein aMBF1 (putative translation factor)
MAKRKATVQKADPARPARGRLRTPRPEGLSGQLGVAVERLRELRGWSSADLARAANLGVGTVIRVEGGRVSPALGTVLALAHAFGISGRDLLSACPDWRMQPEKGD